MKRCAKLGGEETSQGGTTNAGSPSTGQRLSTGDLFAQGHGSKVQTQEQREEWGLTEPAFN